MSDLTEFRDHCRKMATAQHQPGCLSLLKPASYEAWVLRREDPDWEVPTCDGCVTDADRALFARLADEADAYLFRDTQPTLEGV